MRLLLSARQHGWHPAAWRVAEGPVFATSALLDLARRAEQAGFDAVLFGQPALPDAAPCDGREERLHLDALPLMGAAIATTARIGLGGHWPFDVAEPFHVARVLATLDHLSGGRAAWITGMSGADMLRRRYPYLPPLDDDAAARRAAELVEVAASLWDSWEDRGFVADQASGLFADPARVHPILHEGPFFAVRGPLNVPRPVQGRPVIIHHDRGPGPLRRAIAPLADVILADCPTQADARALQDSLAAARHGGAPLLVISVMPVLAHSDADAARRAQALDALAPCRTPRFVGTPDGFAAVLSRWHDASACDGFDLRPAAVPQDLDLICERVLPMLGRAPFPPAAHPGATLRDRLGLQRPASKFATA